MLSRAQQEELRQLVLALHDEIQRRVLQARAAAAPSELAEVSEITASDTIYRIDRVGEEAIAAWLEAHWPEAWPLSLVMEGFDEPVAIGRGEPRLVCIVDPIDGTRALMHDKRSAWALTALAPFRGEETRLRDIEVAALTELPPTKQRLADQVSAVRGVGPEGLRAQRVDVDRGSRAPLQLTPSRATDLRHGFAAFARFFPDGKALCARFEEALFERLYGVEESGMPLIFDDQYLCTGGQFYELLAGRDRMLGDLRPLVSKALGRPQAIACHPYDACAALVLEEAGCRILQPDGSPLDAPLDTTSPVAWVGFANRELEAHVWPAFEASLAEFFPA